VETTGLSSQNGDRVIEIGAVAIENQSIVKDRNLKTLPAGKIFAFEANNAYNRFKL
jgi:DNA polymerase III epsilon subunit-like protein